MAFYGLEPFGDRREDLRAGVVAAAVVNGNPWRKAAQAASPADFFPELVSSAGARDPAERNGRIRNTMRSWAARVEAAQRGKHRQPLRPGQGER